MRDILQNADAIKRNLPTSRDRLDHDEVLTAALVRWVEIIGEAANHVAPHVQRANAALPWREVVSMRNRIIHSYFEVDVDILWDVVTIEIPKLVPQIEAILASLPEDCE